MDFLSLLKYWHRTENLSDNTLVKQALYVQKTDNIQSEWISTIKFLLGHIGMTEHFDNPQMVSNKIFSKLCLTKLKEKVVEQWHFKLTHSDKLRFYKLFKTNLRREPYLDLICNFQLRKFITKFRCSDHRLEIEIGRHQKIPVEERICKSCGAEVETEEHFLRWCPRYSELRFKYFGLPRSFRDWLVIINCENKTTAYNLGNFIKKALILRNKGTA